MNKPNYNVCLWKHSKAVVMSPRGVVYQCNKCDKAEIPAGAVRVSATRKQSRFKTTV